MLRWPGHLPGWALPPPFFRLDTIPGSPAWKGGSWGQYPFAKGKGKDKGKGKYSHPRGKGTGKGKGSGTGKSGDNS